MTGIPLTVVARVESARPRLVVTSAKVHDAKGALVAEAGAKYVPLPPDRNRAFVATLLDDPAAGLTVLRPARGGLAPDAEPRWLARMSFERVRRPSAVRRRSVKRGPGPRPWRRKAPVGMVQ